MARYNPIVITDEGQSIIFQALAGTYTIDFTAVAFGSGEHASDEDLTKLTELDDEKQRVPVSGIAVPTSDSVIVNARVDNTNLIAGYRIREVGIFCKDGSDINSEAVLFAIATAAIPDYMPEIAEGEAPTEFSYKFGLGVGSASSVIISGGGMNGYYNKAEIDALFANYYTKAQIDEMISPSEPEEPGE